jgi:hypothetical protein
LLLVEPLQFFNILSILSNLHPNILIFDGTAVFDSGCTDAL